MRALKAFNFYFCLVFVIDLSMLVSGCWVARVVRSWNFRPKYDTTVGRRRRCLVAVPLELAAGRCRTPEASAVFEVQAMAAGAAPKPQNPKTPKPRNDC